MNEELSKIKKNWTSASVLSTNQHSGLCEYLGSCSSVGRAISTLLALILGKENRLFLIIEKKNFIQENA